MDRLCAGALCGLQIRVPAAFVSETYRPLLGCLGKALLPRVGFVLYFVRLGIEPRVPCACWEGSQSLKTGGPPSSNSIIQGLTAHSTNLGVRETL